MLFVLLALGGGYFGLSRVLAWPRERFHNPVPGSLHMRPMAGPAVFAPGPVASFELAFPGPHYEIFVAGNALAELPEYAVLNGQPIFAWSEPRPHQLRLSFGLEGRVPISDEGLEPFARQELRATELWPAAYGGARLLVVREWMLQRRLFGPPALPIIDVFRASGHVSLPLTWFARPEEALRRAPDNREPFNLEGQPVVLLASSEAALRVVPDSRPLVLATWVWPDSQQPPGLAWNPDGSVRVETSANDLALEDCGLPWLQIGVRSQRAAEAERSQQLSALWDGLQAGAAQDLGRLLNTRDPELIRQVVERLPATLAGAGLPAWQLERLLLAGPRALPTIVGQLLRGGLPGLPFARVSDSDHGVDAFRSWLPADYPARLREWLLLYDPDLKYVWQELRAHPEAHPALWLDLGRELARLHGRSQVLPLLARLLEDTRPAGGQSTIHLGSQVLDYAPRFCDKAVVLLTELAGWPLELRPLQELSGQSLDWSRPEYWDLQRERALAHWQLSQFQPAGWISLQASSLAPQSSWGAELQLNGEWRRARGQWDAARRQLVLGPLPVGPQQLRAFHASELGERVLGPTLTVDVAAESTVVCPVTLPSLPGPGKGWLRLHPGVSSDSTWQVELRDETQLFSWWLPQTELLLGPLTATSYQLRAGPLLQSPGEPQNIQLIAGETLQVQFPSE